MQKTKVHIIPHSHWDKEWYFTSSRSKIYLIKHIKEVLDVLENKEDFGFFLMDAQSSLIEDYLKYCPFDEERLKKLISEMTLEEKQDLSHRAIATQKFIDFLKGEKA